MLAKFSSEAGVAFAKNATGMLNDIKYSQDTYIEYKRFQDSKGVSVPCDSNGLDCVLTFELCTVESAVHHGADHLRK